MPVMDEEVLLAGEALEASPGEADPFGPIIQRVLAGDVEAFGALVALTESQVLSVAWRMLRDRDLAQDAAQEAYLKAFRSLERFRIGEPFRPWFFRILTHVCFDLCRKRGPFMASHDVLDGLSQETDGEHPEARILHGQQRTLMTQALGTLTPRERAALTLRDLEGFTTEETAQSMGVRPATVRSQVAAARTKLQAFCARLTGVRP